MLLSEVAQVSADVARVPGRRAKIDLIAGLLREAGTAEIPIVTAYLAGELRQRQIGVGYAALADLLGSPGEARAGSPPAAEPVLTIGEVDDTFAAVGAIAGAGAQGERRRVLGALFQRATEAERAFLARLIAGELRQGALEGVMIEAVAQAAGVPAPEVRRALLFGGSLPAVAVAALRAMPDPLGAGMQARAAGQAAADPLSALRSFRLSVGRPLRPMLASAAPTIAEAMRKLPRAAVEWKIDGIRVQVHKSGADVAVFTRTLDDITARVPEITDAVAGLPARSVVLDGEAVALYPDGRPRPFQVTAARTGSRAGVEALRGDVPLTPFFFDLLHGDGADLIDEPAGERYARLAALLPVGLVIPRMVTADPAAAAEFFADAVARGHEGVVLKSLDSPYAAGRRGGEWVKVKPRHTFDLVVLAAEWGHGRRRGWLSNLHLAARDPATGDLVMLGKTFKGMTDQMLSWQTERLLELAAGEEPAGQAGRAQAGGVVRVRPELVVEVAFDGVQASRRYPGGLALRFARVLRYRPDKSAADADTIDAVRAAGGYPDRAVSAQDRR